jgi:hypothetical protein
MPRRHGRQGNPLFGIFLLFLPFIIMIISKKRVIHQNNHNYNHPLHKQEQHNDTLHNQQQEHNDTLYKQEQKQEQKPDQDQQHNITKKNKSKINPNPDFMKMQEWNKIIQEPELKPTFCYDYFVIPERKNLHLYALLQ